MNNKILADLEFASLIAESKAQTVTGNNLLDKYKSHLVVKESTCALVNNFIREARDLSFDNGVARVLNTVVDYINMNKTSWALASACESINNNNMSHNYLNRNAASQVEKLLEMNEEDVVKYIKAGALKNVMYCESFRNIAKQVFAGTTIVESTADYTAIHPISMTENVGDGICFEVRGQLYKIDDDKNIQESDWNEVSNTFKTITRILESQMTSYDEGTLTITVGDNEYIITEDCKCEKCNKKNDKKKEMTVEELREDNRIIVMATNPRHATEMARVLESIALVCENFKNIVNMNNVSIYTTNRDQFVVIESNTNLYAKNLSGRSGVWAINENVIDVLSFIKTKTNVSLSDKYKDVVAECVSTTSEEEKKKIEQNIHESNVQSIKERIALLTEKFKNDPVKLAVLSQLAMQVTEE